MPAPGLLARGLAKVAGSEGWLGSPGSHHESKGRRRVVFLAPKPKACGQHSVRDQGINAASEHSKMWFLAGGALTAA